MKQSAGHNVLGGIAGEFAHLNDDILFGEVWAREDRLPAKLRSLLTVTVLVSKGLVDTSFRHHLELAKRNGLTRSELVEAQTHVAFYAGWPNAWVAFRQVLEVYGDDNALDPGAFGLWDVNPSGRYFIGKSYVKMLTCPDDGIAAANVTFSAGCRNNWHIHKAGGQILLCTSGLGWYQEWGSPARPIKAGDVVVIKPSVKHWHGARKDSCFSHIAFSVPAEGGGTEWLEPVDEALE